MSSDSEHYSEVRGILFKDAEAVAIDFKKNVVDWIVKCRTEGSGIPTFRTGFAQRPFKKGETFFVMGVCWMGSDIVQSQWFTNVPKEDHQHMHENHDDYTYILKKYGGKSVLAKAIQAPVVV